MYRAGDKGQGTSLEKPGAPRVAPLVARVVSPRTLVWIYYDAGQGPHGEIRPPRLRRCLMNIGLLKFHSHTIRMFLFPGLSNYVCQINTVITNTSKMTCDVHTEALTSIVFFLRGSGEAECE